VPGAACLNGEKRNTRKLIDVLDFEIWRSSRTERPFAILLLDMDDLKATNDRFGHLAGRQALCRLADILRIYCRAIDIAARYGGDEFVLVLPETDMEEAERVAQRIQARVRDDSNHPPISVSIGTAVYPQNGETPEQLIVAADRAMYARKRLREHTPAPLAEKTKTELSRFLPSVFMCLPWGT
jgi:diguanylate cyclase (GGDEF)-like protein